jgi:Fic family protein
MGEFELFLNDKYGRTDILEKIALAHIQFETIHPFLDGIGRVGRLLIRLLFCTHKVLRLPLLYISLYLKQNRDEYYDRLDNVRLKAEWEEWILFFSRAVSYSAESAADTALRLVNQADTDREKIRGLGRTAGSVLMVFQEMVKRTILDAGKIVDETGLVPNTVNKCLGLLEKLHITEEVTGRSRNRIYVYKKFLDILNEE